MFACGHFSSPRMASCASSIAASCRLLRLSACLRMLAKRSSLEDIAPSTSAAAASERLLKIPMATIESRVSTTRLFILATTGMSRSSPSNPAAEMFFNTLSRRVVRFGFSFFSDTGTNPSCNMFNLYLRLCIVYLPYVFCSILYFSE